MRIHIIVALLFLHHVCFAQIEVPRASEIDWKTAAKYIHDYQIKYHTGSGSPSRHFPCYFLVNVSGLGDKLFTLTDENRYLHIYLGQEIVNEKGKPTKHFYVALEPAYKDFGSSLIQNASDDYVWISNRTEPYCCSQYDATLDGPASSTCSFSQCDLHPGIIDGGNNTVLPLLRCHQDYPEIPFSTTYAFVINAEELTKYLLDNSNIHYLEIYAGFDTDTKSYKLILVSVDDNGVHSNIGYAFDESVPCPKCATFDKRIDPYPGRGNEKKD